ncbi:MAG: hypothetical protein U0232_29350 [Thermomicrobiales bacterium]
MLNEATHELVQFDPVTKGDPRPPPSTSGWRSCPSALTWRPIPAPQLLLMPGETCFLRIERTRMLLDPRPGVRERRAVLGRVEILPGIFERVTPDAYGPSPSTLQKIAARGPLFATDRRVVFSATASMSRSCSPRLDGIEADEGFALHRAARTDTFGFDADSAFRVRDAIRLLMRGESEAGSEQGAVASDSAHGDLIRAGGPCGRVSAPQAEAWG